jgi:uncharacterized membrane protein
MNYKKDHLGFGILLGIVLPLLVYLLLEGIMMLASDAFSIRQSTKELMALVIVLPVFRYYIATLKAERTGQGMMLVIFAYALFFAFRHFNIL